MNTTIGRTADQIGPLPCWSNLSLGACWTEVLRVGKRAVGDLTAGLSSTFQIL
jgi:hypothetical protein